MAGEWREVSLGELFKVKHGFAFKGEFFTDEPKQTILVTPGNFAIGGGFQDEKRKYYSGPVPEDYVLRPGQVVVTMTDLSKQSDTLGYAARIPQDTNIWLHNQRVGLLVFNGESPTEPRFVEYLLRSHDYRSWVVGSATGTTVKHTSPNRIESYKTRVPPLADQRAIAHILGTLDDKIELNRRMNETLEAIARAIFKSWFVDFDPVRAKASGEPPESICRRLGLTPDLLALFPDRLVDSELGEIPEGWGMGTVDAEFDLTMGQSPPGNTYNEAGEGLPFYQGRTDFGFRFPSRRVFCTAPTRFAEAGDTLVSVRAPVGDINMAEERCCIGRGVAAARHRSGSRSYTYYFMQSIEEVFKQFEAEGTVFGSISKKDFHNIERTMPPNEIVHVFDQISSPIDEQIANISMQSKTLSELRDALLPKLLSGELRVPTEGVA